MAESNLLPPPPDADQQPAAPQIGSESLQRGDSDKAVDVSGDGGADWGRSEALGRGISSLMTGVIRDFDSKAEESSASQDRLSSSLDRLTRELDQLLEDAPVPFIMQHAARISGVRKRVSSLNLVLRTVQRRLDNIDRMLSVGSPHGPGEKSSAGGSKLP